MVSGNTIYYFAGDGIRNTGDNNIFRFNCIYDAIIDDYYEPGGNYDDMFQAWTFGNPIKNIVIENNLGISCTDSNLNYKAKIVQGIVCFDGFEERLDYKNNIVITDHPHGISLLEQLDVRSKIIS
ncbi:MAG: hypothetical protein R2771_10490 [Saprospiraceae bacterium]